MSGLPWVFGTTAALAAVSLRRGSRATQQGPLVEIDLTSENFRIDKAALDPYPAIEEADFSHLDVAESVLYGRAEINNLQRTEIMAIRQWNGPSLSRYLETARAVGGGGSPTALRLMEKEYDRDLKESFPDVPEWLRRMTLKRTIREKTLSPKEKAWLKMARTKGQQAIRDPHNRLREIVKYWDQEIIETTTIPGLPGRWVVQFIPLSS